MAYSIQCIATLGYARIKPRGASRPSLLDSKPEGEDGGIKQYMDRDFAPGGGEEGLKKSGSRKSIGRKRGELAFRLVDSVHSINNKITGIMRLALF